MLYQTVPPISSEYDLLMYNELVVTMIDYCRYSRKTQQILRTLSALDGLEVGRKFEMKTISKTSLKYVLYPLDKPRE